MDTQAKIYIRLQCRKSGEEWHTLRSFEGPYADADAYREELTRQRYGWCWIDMFADHEFRIIEGEYEPKPVVASKPKPKRIPYFVVQRRLATGADYSGVLFCFDEFHACEAAKRWVHGQSRTVEVRRATVEEIAAKKARMAELV
jgi:hypothetical protein